MDGREWFERASQGFQRVVEGIGPNRWEAEALGEWDLRALLGHTCRAFLTIELYLDPARMGETAELHAAADYFRVAREGRADPHGVAERGRAAGRELGDTPVATALAIAERVTLLVERTPDDALVATPMGTMRLVDYLATRAFELTVHGLDIAGATAQQAPSELEAATAPALALCAEIADPPHGIALLRAATGRAQLPSGFSVL